MNILRDTPESSHKRNDKHSSHPEKDDFVLSGMFVTFGLLAIVGILVYLLTVQTNAQKCEPVYGENGEVINNCPPPNVTPNMQQPNAPGGIQFLDNLNNHNKIPELDGAQ